MKKPCSKPPLDLTIATGCAFSVADVADVGIECLSGNLWITVDDDLRDIVLEPGQRFQSGARRKVLVSALSNSSVRVYCARLLVGPDVARPTRRWRWPLWHASMPAALSPT